MGTGLVQDADRVIDRTGLVAFQFLELHCHLRDPGLVYKEDIMTGTRAAAAGAIPPCCCMPNTKPVTDSARKL